MNLKYRSYALSLVTPLLLLAGSAYSDSSQRPRVQERDAAPTTPSVTLSQDDSSRQTGKAVGESRNEQAAAKQQQSMRQLVLNFSDGAAELKPEAREKIKAALAGGVDKQEITAAVWSDKPWSPVDEKSFTKEDKQLAEQRGRAIKDYINELYPKQDFEVITMTEKAGIFAKMHNTEEAEIKSVFAKQGSQQEAGKQDSKEHQEAALIRDHGGPGKAVLVIKQEGK